MPSPPPAGTTPEPACADSKIRVLYRDQGGTLHADWPVEDLRQALDDPGGCLWIDIEECEAQDAAVEALLRDVFGFHPLAIEDAVRQSHVAKLDDWGDYLYIVFHALEYDPSGGDLRLHELDIFLGRNYLLTYHCDRLQPLEDQRRNIERAPKARVNRGPGQLLYNLLDAIVADYLPAIEHLDEAIDRAQDEVFGRPTPATIQDIFRIKRCAIRLYRVLAPQREVLNRLARDPFGQIDAEDRLYFRDIYDHIVRTNDIAETLRDLISGALDTYLSAVSNRTNEIMKTLTLVTVMFLPMSFLAGFFGMNFFGETLEFKEPPLPRAMIFWITLAVMAFTPYFLWDYGRRKGWF